MTTEKTNNTWKTLSIIGLVFGGLGLILSLFGSIGMYVGILGLILAAIGAFLSTKQGGKMVLPIIAVLISLAAAGNGYRMSLKYQEAFDKMGKEWKKEMNKGFDKMKEDLNKELNENN